MDASCSKRAVREISGPEKKPVTAIKPLKPSLRSSSNKNIKGCSSNCTENSEKKVCSNPESSSVSSGIQIQELSASGSQTSKSNRKSNSKCRRKGLTQGEKGKKIIGVSTNEARVSVPKNTRNAKSSRRNKSLNLETSKRSTNQTRELSVDGDHSDASTDRATVGSVDDSGRGGYNVEGIADVLLALDRYGEDEELTYEQLLSLEANFFLGGVNFNDQHRDMRLDIDNMSYEDLLVLEEKMGTVSTTLSEEELSKCIKTSIYESLQLENGKTRCSSCADDSKCSICQEEFVRGDEVGRLECGHVYHTPCINQWLGVKNWCPICKATPTPA